MELVFFGSGAFGIPTLARLAREHRVRAVVTQPDRPAGRGGRTTPTPVAEWAGANLAGAEVIKPEDAGAAEVVARVRAMGAGAFVVIAFGQKLSPALLDGVFAINLHASLLPRWRGAAPINWAILGGDRETGNSVISLAERMDAGLIYAQSRREIGPAMTAGDLHDQLASDGPDLVARVLADFARGAAAGRLQDESARTRAPKLTKEMGVVDFARAADECRRRINGLSPWPGVAARFRGEPLRLLRSTEAGVRGDGAGAILGNALDGVVGCGDGSCLALLEVQPPGKRVMSWRDFVNGHAVKSGEVLVGDPVP